MEISGTGLKGINAWYEADIARDWLEEHDLLVTDDVADVSFYRQQGEELSKIPSRTGHSDREGHLSLVPDLNKISDEDRYSELEDGLRLVIAGKTDGIDRGRYAIGPDGQCEELEEDETVPYGWEEIEASCDIHNDAVSVREDLERTMSVETDRSRTPDGYELPERFKDRADEIRNLLDAYEVREAQNRTDQLEDDIRDHQNAMREIQRRQDRYDDARDRYDVPDGYEDAFNWSSRIDNLTTQYQEELNDGDLEGASTTAEELNRLREERRRQLSTLQQVVDNIERLNSTDLTEEQEDDLIEARKTLKDGNLEEAEEQVDDIMSERQDSGITNRIAEVIGTILQELFGGGSSFQAKQDVRAQEELSRGEGTQEPYQPDTNGTEEP